MSELVEILVKNRQLASSEAMVAYENALNALWKAPKNSADLPRLISAFCDVEDYEGMWSLLHYVESFGGGDYVKALVEATPQLPPDGQDWWRRLYRRILNSDTGCQSLKAILPMYSAHHRNAVREILRQVVANADEAARQHLANQAAFVLAESD